MGTLSCRRDGPAQYYIRGRHRTAPAVLPSAGGSEGRRMLAGPPPPLECRREPGETSPEIGEVSPQIGEGFPEIGRRFPNLREAFPQIGQPLPEIGEDLPDFGEHFPNLGELFPNFGERFPEIGEHSPEIGQPFPKIRRRFPNLRGVFPIVPEALGTTLRPLGALRDARAGLRGREIRLPKDPGGFGGHCGRVLGGCGDVRDGCGTASAVCNLPGMRWGGVWSAAPVSRIASSDLTLVAAEHGCARPAPRRPARPLRAGWRGREASGRSPPAGGVPRTTAARGGRASRRPGDPARRTPRPGGSPPK